jgi:glutamine synthetase
VAVNYGLEHTEEALATSRNLHVEAADRRRKRLRTLPVSCSESADNLEVNRKYYESDGVFPKELIDNTVARLKAYKDGDMWKEMSRKPQMFGKMLREYLHYG